MSQSMSAMGLRSLFLATCALASLAFAPGGGAAADYPSLATTYTTAPPALASHEFVSSSADTLRTRRVITAPALLATTPSPNPGVSPAHYDFPPGSTAFHLATAIVHATRALARFEGMLATDAPASLTSRPLVIALNGDVTSTATDSTLSFITENGRCAADDASVVVHELGHALLYRHGIVPTSQARETDYPFESYRNKESLALHEGTVDYLQATYTGQTFPALYFFGYPRTTVVTDPGRYHLGHYDDPVLIRAGLSTGEMQYLNGMIWSGALWDLRNAIGPAADTLVVRSLPFWPKVPTFESAADAVRYAAVQMGSASILAEVEAVFAARGIGASWPVVDIRDVALAADIASSGAESRVSCHAHVAGGLPPYDVRWHTLDPNGVPGPEMFGDCSNGVALPEGARLVFEVRDARDRIVSDTLVVPERCHDRVTVSGPTLVAVGEAAQFTLARESCLLGVAEAATPAWWRVRHADGSLVEFATESPVLEFVPSQPGRVIGCVGDACDSLLVFVSGAFSVGLSAAATYCNEPTMLLAASAKFGLPPYTYAWSCENSAGAPCWIDGGNSPTATLHPGFGYVYDVYVSVTDAMGQTASATANITQDPACAEGARAAVAPGTTRDAAFALPGQVQLRLAAPRHVNVAAYDVLGRRVAEVFDGVLPPGEHRLDHPSTLPRGTVYFLRVFGTDRTLVLKAVAP